MEGGAALGLGFTLLERLETASGRFTASNFDGYLIPTIADMGRVTVAAVTDIPEDALGPRGVGEISVNAAAPAIISAIHAATGFVARQLPIRPGTTARPSGGKCMIAAFHLDGREVTVESDWNRSLLSILREQLDLTSAKPGCEIGRCGACTVLLDGDPVNSCLVPLAHVEGRKS